MAAVLTYQLWLPYSATRGLLETDLVIFTWPSDEDDTRAGTTSPNFHTTPTEGRLSLDGFNLKPAPSARLELMTRQPRVRYLALATKLLRPLQNKTAETKQLAVSWTLFILKITSTTKKIVVSFLGLPLCAAGCCPHCGAMVNINYCSRLDRLRKSVY
ncbi:hypothetical protein TNCV_1529721 [Trichonephila clavipes]|uniref:Uncharacterized protein n=1 Tax=Trichonephila clavipes TaxID=2585209 RepID=A0A8X6VMC1_TRICX|nr:hypothetical protein TNCV_1529721 [Trichonephila clavipes]